MNKDRRKRIQEAINMLEDSMSILNECADEEQDYMDNMPENLQCSEKYDTAEYACDALTDTVSQIEDAIDSADNAVM